MIDRDASSLFIIHSLTVSCSTYLRKKKILGLGRKRLLLSRVHLIFWGALLFGADSISEEVAGFSPFMVSLRKNIVFIVSCV